MALNRKKKIIIAVAAIVVLALVVIISVVATRKEQPEVTTVKVDVRPELRSTVTASGEVRPIRYIKLTSEVPGRILEIYVNPGDQVNKGQSLVRVDGQRHKRRLTTCRTLVMQYRPRNNHSSSRKRAYRKPSRKS